MPDPFTADALRRYARHMADQGVRELAAEHRARVAADVEADPAPFRRWLEDATPDLGAWEELDVELIALECWESGRRSRQRRRLAAERRRHGIELAVILALIVIIVGALIGALNAGAPLGSFAGS